MKKKILRVEDNLELIKVPELLLVFTYLCQADLLPRQGRSHTDNAENFTIGVYVDGILRYRMAPRNQCYEATDVAGDIIDFIHGETVS